MSRKISDTTVPTIIVSRYDLGEKYPSIGYGTEGEVYRYDDKYALKRFSLFRAMEYFYERNLELKFSKIEEMTKLHDESICFPVGILGFKDMFMEGCYFNLVDYEPGKKDFEDLSEYFDRDERIDLLIKGDEVLRRIHNMGMIIGDVKEDNIMIDKNNNPIFVDVDNYAYGYYPFSLFPDRITVYERMHGHEGKCRDCDIMLYTLMSLRMIFSDKDFTFSESYENIMAKVRLLDLNDEIREYIELILSDSIDKPYVSPLLQKIKAYKL